MYAVLANLVALLHGLICGFVLASALAALSGRLRRYPRWEAAFYLLAAAIAVLEYSSGCPLTAWEKHLRDLQEPGSAYRGSFLSHYLPWLDMRLYIRLVVALFLAAFLAFPFWRWMDRRSARARRRAARLRH